MKTFFSWSWHQLSQKKIPPVPGVMVPFCSSRSCHDLWAVSSLPTLKWQDPKGGNIGWNWVEAHLWCQLDVPNVFSDLKKNEPFMGQGTKLFQKSLAQHHSTLLRSCSAMSHFDINTRNEKKIEKDHIHVEHIRNVRRHFWNLPFCPCLGRSPLSRNPRNHCHWAVCVQPWLACHFMDIFCGGLDWRWWAVALPSLELLLHCCWCMPGKNCCLCSLTPKIHKDLNPFCGIVFVFLSGLKLMAAEDRT